MITSGLAQTSINPKSASELFQSNRTRSLLHRLRKEKVQSAMSWNHLSWEPACKWNQTRTAAPRDIQSSLLMILFEHLDVALPEANLLNCQPANSLFMRSQFRTGFQWPRLGEPRLAGLEKVGKRQIPQTCYCTSVSLYMGKKSKHCTQNSFKSWLY